MTRNLLVALGLALAFAPNRLSAQLSTGNASTGVGGVTAGIVIPTGDLTVMGGTGWHIGYGYAVGLGAIPVHLRLEGVYYVFGSKTYNQAQVFSDGTPESLPPDVGPYHFTGRPRMAGALASLVWEPLANSETATFRPYLMGGAGLYYMWLQEKCSGDCVILVSDPPQRAVRVEGEVTLKKIGYNVGAGVSFEFGATTAHLEARMHLVPQALPLQGQSYRAQFIPLSLGILFR